MISNRIAKAIIIAPLSVFPLIAIPALSLGWAGPIIGLIAVAFAYIGMLVIGIPSMLLLRRYGATRWWQLTLAGAIGPVCAGWISHEGPSFTVSAAAFGALVAGAAWFIAFRRLPEQETTLEQVSSRG